MSERDIDADLKTAAQSSHLNYVVMVRIDFAGAPVYIHNSVGTLTYNNNDYLGVGAFGSIDPIQETNEITDSPITLTLSSITPEIISSIKNTDLYGKEVEIYLAKLDDNAQIEGTPESWVFGYIEGASLSVGKENAVQIKVQTEAARLRRRNNRRWTIEHHQKEFAGDLFFEFLPYVIQAEVQWAGEKVRSGFTNTDDNLGGSGGTTTNPDRGFGPNK